jgi:hypothetical protein
MKRIKSKENNGMRNAEYGTKHRNEDRKRNGEC